ncbi:MAG: DUF1028 domain-containing protein [Rhodovarius sp.]|nr:DUF1028 domain-containing protein [Rhodovarius sp.]MCX7933459.1 DUF1028 domain-containing protein [Rhodovarius sp.]MDW8313838.1 DUF1028 domain-containing protein [Rhodovarius sp.]
MTWSLLARDPQTGALACAVATCNLAVGASVPFLRSGVGAVATQSITNRYLGPAVLDGLARGLSPDLALAGAIATDLGRRLRQVHVLDAAGRAAAWTGDRCVAHAGALSGPGWSLAGNMLAGPEVLSATAETFLGRADLPLPERMLAAMQAGERAGGDRRGRQSAAIRLVSTEDFPDLDLRVDDHADPLAELARLLGLWRQMVAPRLEERPRRADPAGLIDLEVIEARFRAAGLPVAPREAEDPAPAPAGAAAAAGEGSA